MIGSRLQCMSYLSHCDDSKRYEVKEVKPKRSLTQNAYYWVMLNKLARVLNMSDSEVHLNMLREYGQCEIFELSTDVPCADYFKYFDILDQRDNRRTVKVYKESSRMDSSEFTHLIGGMREECVSQGIDVATPEEIARMKFVEGVG